MKIFFDTNIVMEYILERESFQDVERIVAAIDHNDWYCYISSASLYTMAYTIEKYLKQEDKESAQPRTKRQRIALLRQILWNITDMFNVVGMTSNEAKQAIENLDFDDLEDAMQYETAINAKCDVLLTLNIDDFEDSDKTKIEIYTPKAFCENYL